MFPFYLFTSGPLSFNFHFPTSPPHFFILTGFFSLSCLGLDCFDKHEYLNLFFLFSTLHFDLYTRLRYRVSLNMVQIFKPKTGFRFLLRRFTTIFSFTIPHVSGNTDNIRRTYCSPVLISVVLVNRSLTVIPSFPIIITGLHSLTVTPFYSSCLNFP